MRFPRNRMASPSTQLIQECVSDGLLAVLDQHKTILVIEDDHFVRRATCELLTNAGHHAIEAEHATIACGLFARDSLRVDAVVCDTVLPDASGIELCKMFQREDPELSVILTSGYPISADALERDSRCYFLEKPYSGESLLAMVALVLAKKRENRSTLLPRAIPDHAQNLPG